MESVEHTFTDSLPDLIDASEYERYPKGTLVRFRIAVTDSGVEILGDGLRPELVEAVLAAVGAEPETPMEQMLCG